MKRTDIPEINNSSFSYENFFNIYETDQGYRFYNLLKNISIFASNNSEIEQEYISDYTDTWYSISYRVYGTLNLWWLICLVNNIQDATKNPALGTQIKAIKPQFVGAIVNQINIQLRV